MDLAQRRITEAAVFSGGLCAVATRTKRLPVGAIPENFSIPAMRDDVIDYGRRSQPSGSLASDTHGRAQ